MWPFKKKPEPPEEKAALDRLDEATREVSAGELHKEAPGLLGVLGPLRDEPVAGSEPGLRETLHEGEEEYEEKHGGAKS